MMALGRAGRNDWWHDPRLHLAGLLALIVALIWLFVWQVFRYGEAHGSVAFARLNTEVAQLQARVEQLDARNAQLERERAVIDRGQQIDQQAYAALKQEQVGLHDEIRTLREELAFYRGIMDPDDETLGLDVQGFVVEPAPGNGRYRIRFVLVQVGKGQKEIKGDIELQFEGSNDSELQSLQLEDVADVSELAYRLRYFQKVEVMVGLPDGYQPNLVQLRLQPATKRQRALEWTFIWPLSEGQAASGS